MIYHSVAIDAPIRQGDIFRDIPRVDFSLAKVAFVEENQAFESNWQDLLENQPTEGITAVVPVKPVTAIVVTQNCDALRGQYVSLCEVDKFLVATGKVGSPPGSAKKWKDLIVRHSKENLRWFYLPRDAEMGFPERMAVDFRLMIRVCRSDLEEMRSLRIARLNKVATEHFRETLAQFFRRYPYNEWYPLTREEFETYREASPEPVEPYSWQS